MQVKPFSFLPKADQAYNTRSGQSAKRKTEAAAGQPRAGDWPDIDDAVEVEVSEEFHNAELEQEAVAEDEQQQSALEELTQKRMEEQELREQLDASRQAGGMNGQSSKPEDNSGALNKRLVAAISQFEVQQVIATANKDLIGLRVAAAMCSDEDAKAIRGIIKKLEKIVNRGRRKITDLTKEEGLKQEEISAKQQREDKRAEEIKAELRKRVRERRIRERKYLAEDGEKVETAAQPNQKLDAATEAQIEAQAEVRATAEVSAGGDAGSGDTGSSGGTEGSSSSSGGAETSGDAGGGGAEASVDAE